MHFTTCVNQDLKIAYLFYFKTKGPAIFDSSMLSSTTIVYRAHHIRGWGRSVVVAEKCAQVIEKQKNSGLKHLFKQEMCFLHANASLSLSEC